jgi:hypothetical protein
LCKKEKEMNLQENIRKILKEWNLQYREKLLGMSYVELEKLINKLAQKKFPWWKGLEIQVINYSELNDVLTIYGELNIDMDWGKKEWEQNTQINYKEFPYNLGWDEESSEHIPRYDDFIRHETNKEVSNFLIKLFKSATNFQNTEKVRLDILKIKFI